MDTLIYYTKNKINLEGIPGLEDPTYTIAGTKRILLFDTKYYTRLLKFLEDIQQKKVKEYLGCEDLAKSSREILPNLVCKINMDKDPTIYLGNGLYRSAWFPRKGTVKLSDDEVPSVLTLIG